MSEIIEGNKLTSYVFTASLLFPSISGVLFSLYDEISDNKLQLMELPHPALDKLLQIVAILFKAKHSLTRYKARRTIYD